MSEFYGEMDSDNSGNNHIFLFQYVGEQENSYIKIGVKTRIYNSSSEQLVAVIYTDYLTKLDRIFFLEENIRKIYLSYYQNQNIDVGSIHMIMKLHKKKSRKLTTV